MNQIVSHIPSYMPAVQNFVAPVLKFLGDIARSVAAAHQASADAERLSRMTDAQLDDMGLTREAALRGVYKRNFD